MVSAYCYLFIIYMYVVLIQKLEITAGVENLKCTNDDTEQKVPSPIKKKVLVDNVDEASVLVTLDGQDQSVIYTGVQSFEELNIPDDLLKGIFAMGFQKPSIIQEKALPLLFATPPKNLIGQSQAGKLNF